MAIPVKVSAPAPAARPALAVAVAAPAARPATVKLIDKADPSQRRAMRLALLDQTLGGVAGSGGDAAPSAKAAR
jgi:hypothetical protein